MSDGEHAFPSAATFAPDGKVIPYSVGMTLRDYFAAKALQGMLAHGDEWQLERRAYVHADNMLKARGK